MDGTNETTASDGDSVATWGDRSGNATDHDATQGTGSAQPTYDLTSEIHSVAFDGGDWLDMATGIQVTTESAGFTICFVGKATDNATNSHMTVVGGDSGDSAAYTWVMRSNSAAASRIHYYGGNGYKAFTDTTGRDCTDLNMFTFTKDSASTTDNMKIFAEGGTNMATEDRANTFLLYAENIGRRSSGGYLSKASFYEILVFGSLLSNANLDVIKDYFDNKYSDLPTLTSFS